MVIMTNPPTGWTMFPKCQGCHWRGGHFGLLCELFGMPIWMVDEWLNPSTPANPGSSV